MADRVRYNPRACTALSLCDVPFLRFRRPVTATTLKNDSLAFSLLGAARALSLVRSGTARKSVV